METAQLLDLWNKARREVVTRLAFFLPEERRRSFERRLRGRDEAHALARADCAVVSFGKSGRTWLRVMISHYHRRLAGLGESRTAAFGGIQGAGSPIPSLFYTHDNYLGDYTGNAESKADYFDKKVVLLVRKPQDVAMSQYFQWKHRMRPAKKWLNGYPPDGTEMGPAEFVVESRWGIHGAIEFLNRWAAAMPRCNALLVVRYEDLRADPHRELARVVEFIDGRADDEAVKAAVEYGSIENMRKLETSGFTFGRRLRPGDRSNPESFKVRKAKVGGYRDYLDEAQVGEVDARVDREVAALYGYRSEDEAGGAGTAVDSEAREVAKE